MANFCVGPANTGGGTGADWNNIIAYASVTFARGNTYYLADGAYTSKELGTAESTTVRIIIKKAIESDHGTATGWVSTLGDGQAVFSEGMVISTGYWTFDGQTGGGPSNWTSGFGIAVPPSDTNNGAFVATLGGSPAIEGLDIRHIDITGPSGGGSDNGKPVSFYTQNCNNSTFAYLKMVDMGSNMFRSWGVNITVEYCYFGFFLNTAGNHGECMSVFGGTGIANWTVRYCLFTFTDGTGGLIFADDGGAGTYEFYGNIFAPVNGGSLGGGNGLIGCVSGRNLTNLRIRQNTFIGWTAPMCGIFDAIVSGFSQNNLFYNGTTYGDMAVLTCSFNHFASAGAGVGTNVTTSVGDPFVNWTASNFALTSNTTPGTNLGAPYNVDMLGNTRTTWTRGAIEFTGGSTPSGGVRRIPTIPTLPRIRN